MVLADTQPDARETHSRADWGNQPVGDRSPLWFPPNRLRNFAAKRTAWAKRRTYPAERALITPGARQGRQPASASHEGSLDNELISARDDGLLLVEVKAGLVTVGEDNAAGFKRLLDRVAR